MADYLSPLRAERDRRRLSVTVRLVRIHATPDEVLELQKLVAVVNAGQMPASEARVIVADVQTRQQRRLADEAAGRYADPTRGGAVGGS